MSNSEEQETINGDSVIKLIRYLFIYVLVVIIMVHFLAVFGILISLTFPFAWLFLPNQVFCVFCLHQKLMSQDKHPHCPVCKREVTTIYDPPLRSVIINSLVFFIISNICLLFFLFEINYLFKIQIPLPNFSTQQNAQLVVNQNATSSIGIYTFDVYVDSNNRNINTAETDFKFNPLEMQVLAIQTDQSFVNIFVRKDFSNTDGTINITGGLPAPGYIGKGLLAKVLFKKLTASDPQLVTLSSSKVLANDGDGTNILPQSSLTLINISQ